MSGSRLRLIAHGHDVAKRVRRAEERCRRGRPCSLRGLERLEDRAMLAAVPTGFDRLSDVQAAAIPPSTDIAVNLVPAGNQDAAAVAMDGSGNYVVAWVTYGRAGDRARDGNIVARRFDRSGKPVGSEFVVNTHFAGSQVQPDVAMDYFGNFVVVWSGEGQDGSGRTVDPEGVFFRRFDRNGTPQDAFERQAATYAKGTQYLPSVAMDPQGDFVIAWSGEGREGEPLVRGLSDGRGVWARRFNAFGQALDRYQTLVNSVAHRGTTQEAPDVAMDGAGNYFIVWRSERQDAGAWGVYGQRFNANGLRNGGEMHLNRKTYGSKLTAHVAMNAQGDSVVVWSGSRGEGRSTHVYARRFDVQGKPIGTGQELVVDSDPNPKSPYLKQHPAVAINSQGDFAVAWASFGQDQANDNAPRDDGVYTRLFRADGSAFRDPASGQPLGAWRVNATTLGDQNAPGVAMDSNGNLAYVWTGPDADRNGIWTRPVRITAQISATDAAVALWAAEWSRKRESLPQNM